LPISRKFALLWFVGLGLSVAGCTARWMPVAGPESWDVRGHVQDPDGLPYALVKVTPPIIDVLATSAPRLSRIFTDRRRAEVIKFGIGDTVSVTVFESAAGGLFIPSEAGVRPGNFVQLPNQNVDPQGNITVPYAGSIQALGRTPAEVQQSIVNALRNRAIEPQVVVALVTQNTSLASVLGEVNKPLRVPLSAAGERILDTITSAGGPRSQGFDTWVMLEREGKRATVPFGALVYEPSNNIFTRPNDTIYVYSEPQTFVALGALGPGPLGGSPVQGQLKFDAWRLSLAEAVGKAGGLNETLADPASVFLYRGETREIATRLGLDITRFEGPLIPVVYNINFRDPGGYFLAAKFEMRNKDVIFASNSISVEQGKIYNYIRLVSATVNDPLVAGQNLIIFRNALLRGPHCTVGMAC